MNGFEHIFTLPFHPVSSGAAENVVKSIKYALKKANHEGKNLDIVQQFIKSNRKDFW